MLMSTREVKKLSKFLVPNGSLLSSQFSACVVCPEQSRRTWGYIINTLWTGDADFCLYITTVQDGCRKSAFLTRAWFPRTTHLITQ